MRFVGVSDSARSSAFYRDILGFEIREESGRIEAVCGPARLQFGEQDYAPGHVGERRPLGSAMLFFNTSDVSAMHEAIRARGGAPSEIEKVNWIKMRMFEIRDPDGHTLWFGQSYDEPGRARPPAMMLRTLPELPVLDVAVAVAHYRDVLGFHINHQQDDLGVMDRDRITVLLIPPHGQPPGDWLGLCLRRRCGCALRRTAREEREHSGRAGEPSLGSSRFRGARPRWQSPPLRPAL